METLREGAIHALKKRGSRVIVLIHRQESVNLLGIPVFRYIIGWAWQLSVAAVIMISLLAAANMWLHRMELPISWPWVMAYAVGITLVSELIYLASKMLDERAAIHIEVLLPTFVMGCLML